MNTHAGVTGRNVESEESGAKTLFFFTNSYPYGLGELWKSNELEHLVRYFKKITIVPFTDEGNYANPKSLPAGVICEQPLFRELRVRLGILSIFRLFNRNAAFFLSECVRSRAFATKKKAVAWLAASIQIQMLLRHPAIRRILQEADANTVLYYYWGKGTCDMIPFVRVCNKSVVRMHGYDLFEERSGGYIPYRTALLNHATLVAPSSEMGARYLRERYPGVQAPIRAIPCGVLGRGKSIVSRDNCLRIITCSFLVALKRVDLVIKALHLIDFPVQWTHIGDGPLMAPLQQLSAGLPANVATRWAGRVEPARVLDFFVQQEVDLFINVSETEGVPFSIMEALSASVPVMATDVGGTSDIVDDSVGKLLKSDVTPEQLAATITEFYKLPRDVKHQLTLAARNRFESRCDASTLAEDFSKWLSR